MKATSKEMVQEKPKQNKALGSKNVHFVHILIRGGKNDNENTDIEVVDLSSFVLTFYRPESSA